jgi:hypothetical protein
VKYRIYVYTVSGYIILEQSYNPLCPYCHCIDIEIFSKTFILTCICRSKFKQSKKVGTRSFILQYQQVVEQENRETSGVLFLTALDSQYSRVPLRDDHTTSTMGKRGQAYLKKSRKAAAGRQILNVHPKDELFCVLCGQPLAHSSLKKHPTNCKNYHPDSESDVSDDGGSNDDDDGKKAPTKESDKENKPPTKDSNDDVQQMTPQKLQYKTGNEDAVMPEDVPSPSIVKMIADAVLHIANPLGVNTPVDHFEYYNTAVPEDEVTVQLKQDLADSNARIAGKLDTEIARDAISSRSHPLMYHCIICTNFFRVDETDENVGREVEGR